MWCATWPSQVIALRRSLWTADCQTFRRHECDYFDFPWTLSRIPDTRVPRDERISLLSSFLESEACCLDEFFSRRLRQRLLDLFTCLEHRDLLELLLDSAFFQDLLLQWARLVQVTVMTIENRHAHDRSSSVHKRLQWITFASQRILSEASLLQNTRALEAEFLAGPCVSCIDDPVVVYLPDADDQVLPLVAHAHKSVLVQRVINRKRQLTVRDIVKEQMEASLMKRSDITCTNPALDRRLLSLTTDEYKNVEDMSRASNALARLQREAHRRQNTIDLQIASRPSSSSAIVLVPASPDTSQHVCDIVLRAPEIRMNEWLSSNSLAIPLLDDGHRREDYTGAPLSLEHFNSSVTMKCEPTKKSSVTNPKTLRENLAEEMNVIGTGLVQGQQPFPDTVEYPVRCDGLCSRTVTARYVRMHTRLWSALDKWRTTKSIPSKWPLHDCVLAFEVFGVHSARIHTFFCFWPHTTGSAGNSKASGTFYKAEANTTITAGLAAGRYDGLILTCERLPYIENQLTSKLDALAASGKIGRLSAYTEKQWIEVLLSYNATPTKRIIDRVSVWSLAQHPLSLDSSRITGVIDSVADVRLHEPDPPPVAARDQPPPMPPIDFFGVRTNCNGATIQNNDDDAHDDIMELELSLGCEKGELLDLAVLVDDPVAGESSGSDEDNVSANESAPGEDELDDDDVPVLCEPTSPGACPPPVFDLRDTVTVLADVHSATRVLASFTHMSIPITMSDVNSLNLRQVMNYNATDSRFTCCGMRNGSKLLLVTVVTSMRLVHPLGT